MQFLLRINMDTNSITREKIPDEYKLLGGRGITSCILLNEVDPTCHPLGEKNKLIIAAGILGGTSAPSSGRLSIGAKSPLTGGIKESNAGGTLGRKISRLGIKAIIIEGKPKDEFKVLLINERGVSLEPATDIAGLGNYEASKKLRQKYGDKVGIISIGQAGEHCLPIAGIAASDLQGRPNRFAGRGGLGAVLGSKKIKAIVIDDNGADEVIYHDKSQFNKIVIEMIRELRENPGIKMFNTYGTSFNMNTVNLLGAIPTRNFTCGSYEHIDKISGERMHDIILQRGGEGQITHACMPGCPIMCSNIYPDKNGKEIVSPMEYETMALMGSNLDIADLDEIAYLNKYCNDYGIDTMEMGVTLGVAMGNGLIPFGDSERCKEILDEVAKNTLMGRVFGQGATILAKLLGTDRIPAVKGQGLPAYDPRALKGNIPVYATSPMGADHTCGNSLRVPDPLSPNGKVKASRNLQIAMAAMDSLGICILAGVAVINNPERIVSLIYNRYGEKLSKTFFTDLGKDVINKELEFNKKAGFTKLDNRLPEFLLKEPLPKHNTVCDISQEELDLCLDFSQVL